MRKLDERTKRALDTISHGDTVRFYDCFEAQVYKDKTFIVQSLQPEIYQGKHVLVKLHGLGKFPIGKLVRVATVDIEYGDDEIQEGLRACINTGDGPHCGNCPFNKLGLPTCMEELLRQCDDFISRIKAHEQAHKGERVNG